MTWLGISQVLSSGMRFVATVVLARVLLADDFGIVAMASIITELMLLTADLGLAEAIIQRKEVTESHLSTTFWAGLALGGILCAATAGMSPLVAGFFGKGQVGPVLAVSSLALVIAPLRTVHGSLLRKTLQFSRFSFGEVGSSACYLAVSVSLAVTGFGVWSIVLGSLASQVALVALRWFLCRWRPSRTFSIKSLKELWGFGFSVTGNRLVQALTGMMDQLIIGRFLIAASLGYYYLGAKVPSSLTTPLWMVLNQAAFPTFSLVQDERERMHRGFVRSVTYISLIVFPMFAGLAIVAPQMVPVVYGGKWIQAIPTMQILCIPAVVGSLNTLAGPAILAKGRPNIILKLSLLKIALLVPSLLVGVRFGIAAVAAGVSIVAVIVYLLYQISLNRLIGLRVGDLLNALRPAALGSAVMALGVLGFRYAMTTLINLPDIGLLIGIVLLGGAIYLLTLKLAKTKALHEMIGLALEMGRPYSRVALLKLGLLREKALHAGNGK
jgi:PST family polysaccharide transporter